MSNVAAAWAWQQKVGNPRRKLLLVKLADQANDDGVCWPSMRTLAAHAEIAKSSVDREIKALEAEGFIRIEVRHRPDGGKTSNLYHVNVGTGVSHPDGTGVSRPGRDGVSHPDGTELKENPQVESSVEETPTATASRSRVKQAWLDTAGMVQHRASYFADDSIKRKVDKAVKKYGADDVVSAITAYGAVVYSPDHFFEHRWTFGDFLQRGLDRFVPESKPLEVFLTKRNGNGGGLTAQQIAQQAMEMDDDATA